MKEGPNLRELIEKLRKRRGLSQTQLAKQLRVSRSALSAWETGVTDVPAEVWLKLIPLMDDLREILQAFKAAHVNPRVVVTAAEALAKRSIVSPKEGEMALVSPLQTGAAGSEESHPSLALPVHAIADPLSTRYFIVKQGSISASYVADEWLAVTPEIGDILLVDVAGVEATNLIPFWGELVLIEEVPSTEPRLELEVVFKIGFLYLHENLADLAVGVIYSAELEPWCSVVWRLDREGRKEVKVTPTPLASIPVGRWQGQLGLSAEGAETLPAGDVLAVNQARVEMRLFPYYHILGRVVGWFRPPGKSKRGGSK